MLNEPVSAAALVDRLIESGLSQRYIGNASRVAQVCRSTKGIAAQKMGVAGGQGETYALDGYYLESEEAFVAWVESSW